MKITVIMSPFKTEQSVQANMMAYEDMRKDLKIAGFKFVECMGSYQGNVEKSFEILTSIGHLSTLMSIANDYEQECVLVVSQKDQSVYFLPCTWGSIINWGKPAGKWCRKPKYEVLTGDYTYFPAANVYYTVEK